MLWGGWTCRACGVELNTQLQPIHAPPKAEMSRYVAQLHPKSGFRSEAVLLQVICWSWLLLGLGIMCVGGWVIAGVVVMCLSGPLMFWLLRRPALQNQPLVISGVAIQWGDVRIHPSEVTAVRVEAPGVIIETDGSQYYLDVYGEPRPVVDAIEDVIQHCQDQGSTADVPSALQQHRARRQGAEIPRS